MWINMVRVMRRRSWWWLIFCENLIYFVIWSNLTNLSCRISLNLHCRHLPHIVSRVTVAVRCHITFVPSLCCQWHNNNTKSFMQELPESSANVQNISMSNCCATYVSTYVCVCVCAWSVFRLYIAGFGHCCLLVSHVSINTHKLLRTLSVCVIVSPLHGNNLTSHWVLCVLIFLFDAAYSSFEIHIRTNKGKFKSICDAQVIFFCF